MENIELTIAVGRPDLQARGNHSLAERPRQPLHLRVSLEGKTTRRKTKTKSLHTVARHARTLVDRELRKRRRNQPPR